MTRVLGWLACAGAVALLVLAMITGTSPAAAGALPARVGEASIRLAAVPGRPAAGYFVLTAGSRDVTLTGVTAAGARIELHGNSMAGGVMRMDLLPAVRVAAGQTVRFAPGGTRHLMIFDLPTSVRPGTTVALRFSFADGGSATAIAAVRAAGGDTMPGMKM